MSDADPNLRGLQRLANVIVYAGMAALLSLSGFGVYSLFRLVF